MNKYSFITEDEIKNITSHIPSLPNWLNYNKLGLFTRDMINNTNLSGSIECLNDARNRFISIRIALQEALIHKTWCDYDTTVTDDTQKKLLVATGLKFYLDFSSVNFYSIGEDIADFIIFYLNLEKELELWIKKEDTKRLFENKKISSDAAKIGIFMIKNYSSHKLTEIISKLNNNKDWKTVINHRNTFVHDKPPTYTDLPNGFPRKAIIKKDEHNALLVGLTPNYSTDEFYQITIKALTAIRTVFDEIIEFILTDNDN